MRVVFDTNIFVSAFVIQGGLADKALLNIIEGRDDLVLSKAILDELLSVLVAKFSRDEDEISRIALFLSEIAEWTNPTETIDILKDEPDNRILECATSGKAAAIVTGDKEMLRLGSFRGVKILSLKAYLESGDKEAGS
jgi:putative PIN family toxin of toxin-antitoxin system